MKITSLLISGSLCLTLSSAVLAEDVTKPFDANCFYAHDGAPDWEGVKDISQIMPMGVEMDRNGVLQKLVPKSRLAKSLSKAESREVWYRIFETAPRSAFRVSIKAVKKNQKTPLDFVFADHQEVIFRLFNENWEFADKPITTDHEIPVLSNGFKTHASPFYHKAANMPDATKMASLGIRSDPEKLTGSNCTYKYDLNVDVITGNYKTRIIIDPESSSGTGGFGSGD